jgi:hypothetical protein
VIANDCVDIQTTPSLEASMPLAGEQKMASFLASQQKFALDDAGMDYQGRPWFAWYPVRTVNGWHWLSIVRRCIDTEGPEAGKPYYREL